MYALKLGKIPDSPLYMGLGTWKNSELLLYRELVGETPSGKMVRLEDLEKIPWFLSLRSPQAKHRTEQGASRHVCSGNQEIYPVSTLGDVSKIACLK